jgi:2-polyprenyl-3-methyl-5-hydroxy-6-metoxy-1,4-benzoquinol methylase
MDSSEGSVLGPAEAAAWDLGCAGDEVRNHFVIPSVARLITSTHAATIMDVGCGTGYVCQKLAALEVRWTLLDRCEAMMAFARTALAARDNISYVTASLSSAIDRALVSPHDIVYSAYSILEVQDLHGFARACRVAVREGGVVALYLPDCLEDLASAPDRAFEEFRAGTTRVKKLNAFTRTEMVFFARRIELYLAAFTAEGLALVDLEESLSSAGKRHFALIFRKISG